MQPQPNLSTARTQEPGTEVSRRRAEKGALARPEGGRSEGGGEAGGDLREWRTLAGRAFANIGRARITPRQALIMEQLVRVTLLVGRQSVRIPRLDMFGVFGLSRGNVSDALNGRESPDGKWVPGLVELGLLQLVESNDGGAVFTILPDAAQWRCAWRFPCEAGAVFLRDLNAVADQVTPELSALAREPGLTEAWAEVSLENAAGSQSGNPLSVPKVGTDPPRSHFGNGPENPRSHFGNEQKAPMPARLSPSVPTLGTSQGDPLRVQSSAVSKLSTAELLRGLRDPDRDLLRRIHTHVGESTWLNWGGAWTNAVKRDADLVARVVADYESARREGRVIPNVGGYMWDLVRRWGRAK